MAMSDDIADAIDGGLVALGDLVPDVTYHKVTVGSYDPETNTRSNVTTNVTISAVLYNGRDIEQDSVRRLTSAQSKHSNTDDYFLLFTKNELPAYTPKKTDSVTIDGVLYEIYGTVPVPGNPIWILKVRTAG